MKEQPLIQEVEELQEDIEQVQENLEEQIKQPMY